ncbi:hypothetical protein HPB50_007659 [Hyalomma asiaticum]|uniref:Uncharacterized protein n=1 Tax=Hyalomma asiaticum TaxID=266040 RepID=A0ACB7TGK5_HYAAI|nr:hypothetical protein HPB50_007659 [Hyalomma asiaticum]
MSFNINFEDSCQVWEDMEKQEMCSAVGESHMRSVQESKKELAVQAETTFKKEQVRAYYICDVEKFKKEDYKSNSAAGEIQEGTANLEKKDVIRSKQ